MVLDVEQDIGQVRRLQSSDRAHAMPSNEGEANGLVITRVEEPFAIAQQPPNLRFASRRLEGCQFDLA
jgi:hypothetical protein